MDNEQIQKFPILRSAYGGLTRSERRIADYIAERANQIMAETISDIAAATGSSEITVSRFCKKLGFSGLQELKRTLATELSAAEKVVYHDIVRTDSCQEVTTKIFQNITEGLQDTLGLLDFDAVDKAAALLRQAKTVLVFGFGSSSMVCHDIEARYVRLGLNVRAYVDSHMQVITSSLLTPQDVVIAVSHSGSSKELLQSIRVARQSGAQIIGITSHAKSPLANFSDICLCGMGREVNFSSEASASRFIHLAIAEVLYMRVAMTEGDEFDANMVKIRNELNKKRL